MKVHDNEIINYHVNLKEKTIAFQTISEANNQIDIYFQDFLAYHFENPLPGSILLDMFEEGIDQFIPQNRHILEDGKNYFWPMNYDSEEELLQHLQKGGYHYYIIQSAYGLSGWVVSKEMNMHVV